MSNTELAAARALADAAAASTMHRGLLPEVLLSEDVAVVLNIGVPAARRAIRSGECGPFIRLGRRLAVRRVAFLSALAAREVQPRQAGSLPKGK
jgi:hypothetical protein